MFESFQRSMSLSLLVWINTLGEFKEKVRDHELVDRLQNLYKCARALLPDQDHEKPDTDDLWREHDKEMEVLHRQIHTLDNRDWFHNQIRIIEELQRRLREKCNC